MKRTGTANLKSCPLTHQSSRYQKQTEHCLAETLYVWIWSLSVCTFQLYWQVHFGFSETSSLQRRLSSANGAACTIFCKGSQWEHHPGRWNEPVLVFFLFFSPYVDLLVCTRKPPGHTLLWKANVVEKDKWFLKKALDKQSFTTVYLVQYVKDCCVFLGNKRVSAPGWASCNLKRQLIGCLTELFLSQLNFSISGYS